MKTNQLVMTETEDQGCFLFRWNQELLCYERVATGAYGKQGERFCLLGQSENDFTIWFLDSWGSLCKSPDHCSAAECHVKDDKGVFYLYNGDWYFRNYEEDSEVVLGTELISRNSYYRKGADGCVMVTSVCDGKCEVRSYTGLRVQRDSGSIRMLMTNTAFSWNGKTVLMTLSTTATNGYQQPVSKKEFPPRLTGCFVSARTGILTTAGLWNMPKTGAMLI